MLTLIKQVLVYMYIFMVQLKLRITSLVILIRNSISKLLSTLKFKSDLKDFAFGSQVCYHP